MEKQKNTPVLRFPEFTGGWEIKRLGDITTTISSGKSKKRESSGIYPLYGSTGIIGYSDHYEYSGDNILIARVGANAGSLYKVKGRYSVTDNTIILDLLNLVDGSFIYEFLVRINLNKLVFGSGQPLITGGQLKEIEINLPPLPEQTKIATFLTAVDERLTQLKQKKTLLVQYKKGVMQKIFDQKIRFKDDAGNEYPDWKVKKLGEISKIYDGTHQTPDYKEEGIPFYSVEHVTSNNFSVTKFISKEVFEKENEKVKLEKGDILMTKIGDIGTAKYIDWEVMASFYVSLALIKKPIKNSSEFICHFINSVFFQTELHQRTIHVAFPKKINLGEIGNCLVKLPCFDEQTKIANFLTAIDEKINGCNNQISKTEQYKTGLLQQMFV